MTDMNFWDCNVWGLFSLVAVLLFSLMLSNALKRSIGWLRHSLIPTSVIAGCFLLVFSFVFERITGNSFFDSAFFSVTAVIDGETKNILSGSAALEILTYHTLALGFIAITFRPPKGKMGKKRNGEILDTGVTTVATYLLQGVVGLVLTVLVSKTVMPDLFPAAGALLPYGYGQGTGQALNYGNIYETWGAEHPGEMSFAGGRSFGLAVAALGFLSASIGGVFYLNILKHKKKITVPDEETAADMRSEEIQSKTEIPMNGSIDKMTVQVAIVCVCYLVSYGIMALLGNLFPGVRSVLYGFNFLIGVLVATAVRAINGALLRKNIVKHQHINSFLMSRISGFCFDMMIVAGIAVIRLDVLTRYWWVLLLMGVIGAVITFAYNRFIAKKFFPEYAEEQFMAMYGMLTGTASTGMILLRELDPDFSTPVSENLVYQNLPAIVLGFPMMLIGTLAAKNQLVAIILLAALFVVMNVILFRRQIFRKRK